jgi:hypothetical protein
VIKHLIILNIWIELLKHPSLDGAEFVNAETLSYTHLSKTALKSEDAKVYGFKGNTNLNIESWKAFNGTLASDTLYIENFEFQTKALQREHCYYTNVINELRKSFGIKVPIIYGVKTADLKKTVQPTWIGSKDFILQEFNAWKNNNPDKVRDYEYFKDSNAFQERLVM